MMFEREHTIENGNENITDTFLKCDTCGYEQLMKRRTKFSGVVHPHAF